MSEKTVLVSGAASGIGRGIAEKFLREGAKVLMLDVNAKALELCASKFKQGGLCNFILREFDVSKEEDWISLAEFLDSEFGGLDALVNNAGIGITKPVETLQLGEWLKVLNTNLTSIFLSAKYCSKFLRSANGAMVNIASTRALMSEANTEAYSASKGGVVAVTHALAMSLAPIRVNCVSPGWIDNGSFGALREIDHAQHPSGRVGRVEDIANLVEFLADNSRAGFITGQNFYCDGGMTKKMIYAE